VTRVNDLTIGPVDDLPESEIAAIAKPSPKVARTVLITVQAGRTMPIILSFGWLNFLSFRPIYKEYNYNFPAIFLSAIDALAVTK
jgi:hypothetical protein